MQIDACHFCHSSQTGQLLEHKNSIVMFSDGALRDGSLKKVLCSNCGLVYSMDYMNGENIHNFYSHHYELNSGVDEEHYYIRGGKILPRSEVIYNTWLQNYLPWDRIESLLEVGCGKGSLLNMICAKHPHIGLHGLEANIEACNLARSRGLRIDYGFLNEEFLPDSKFDAVIAIGVIEHVIDPVAFVSHMVRLTKPGGYILVACPDATSFSYDIYFADHLFHLTPDHLKWLFMRNNCEIVFEILNHISLPNFQCIVAVKSNTPKSIAESSIPYTTQCDKAVAYYEKVFEYLDDQLSDDIHGELAAYGGNEILALFFANTKLSRHVSLILDDRPKGPVRLGLPVSRTADVSLKRFGRLVLTLNEEYYGAVIRNLQRLQYSGNVILPLRQEIIELRQTK